MKKIIISLALLGVLQGCAIGVDQMTFSGGMVTSARGGYPLDEIPMTQVKQRDALIVITHVNWAPLDAEAGRHPVSWSWYADGKLVAVRNKDVRFDRSPFRLSWRIPAGDFATGRYRVDVAIDDKVIDSHEYEIVP